MLSKPQFERACVRLMEFSGQAAVQYKTLFQLLDTPYDAPSLQALRPEYLYSPIVQQLYDEQSPYGDWGPLRDKNYSEKALFPTTFVAIERCLYIGLTEHDRDILLMAAEYLEQFLKGQYVNRLYNKNERAVPWQLCEIAHYVERIRPGNPLCDRLWGEWSYIASRAFADGEYSHERDMAAQHELLGTREKRLVPMPLDLLLCRSADLPDGLESAMLNHYGHKAYLNGFFWDKNLLEFPAQFETPKTRRWFHTIKYINRFHGTREYLGGAMEWLSENQTPDGLWNYGPQTNDPWGYFGYFATDRRYAHNRIVDCSMEVLHVMKTYMDHNRS